jgi:hypothetical protein
MSTITLNHDAVDRNTIVELTNDDDPSQQPSSAFHNLDHEPPHHSLPLPPVDTGLRAYTFLFGCFIFELIIWGFPFSFGVLREYYTTHPPFSTNPSSSSISAVGTTCSGILYILAPVTFMSFNFSPHLRKWATTYGLVVVVAALLLSSLATEVWHLVLTQGVLYAIGGCLMYYPVFLYIDEWYVSRKAFAYGILWAGSSSGGLVGPFLLEWGLRRYGVATFLRGWAVGLAICLTPLLFVVKARVPVRNVGRRDWRELMNSTMKGYGFVKTKQFWILQSGNVVQGLGYFIPLLYLPGTLSSHLRLPVS